MTHSWAHQTRPTWTGRRDHALILLAAQTGLRISELIGLTCCDLNLGRGAHVSCLGKHAATAAQRSPSLVFGQAVFERVAAERRAGAGREERVVRLAVRARVAMRAGSSRCRW